MSLIRRKTRYDLMNLPTNVNDFFGDFGLDFWNTDKIWSPAVDIAENNDNYEVTAELPGMKKDEIKISYEDDVLTLSGERKTEKDEKDKNFRRVERCFGKFQRSFYLPKNVKADEIKAKYKNGVLTVNIPKAEETKSKEIAIS